MTSQMIRLCLLLISVGWVMSLTITPWYTPMTGMKRIFNSPPSKVTAMPWNKTFLAPIQGEDGQNYLIDWSNIDYRKKPPSLITPCGLTPAYVINNHLLLTGDSLAQCPCTNPGKVACPLMVGFKFGNNDYEMVVVVDTQIKQQYPEAAAITIAQMTEDIVDRQIVIYENDLPVNISQTVTGPLKVEQWQGCAPATNAAKLKGNVAYLKGALCDATTQAKNAKAAGAVAVIWGYGTSPLMSEKVLPGFSFGYDLDRKANMSERIFNATAAGIPVLLKFGPLIGDINPTILQVKIKNPLGLAFLSLQDFSIVSVNTQLFRQNPPNMWVLGDHIVYTVINDTTFNRTVTYLNVSGAYNEKAVIWKSFDITAKGFYGAFIWSAIHQNGRNYLLTSDQKSGIPEPLTIVNIWDITDESSFKLVWTHNYTGILYPDIMTIRQDGKLIFGFSFALVYSADFSTIWWWDFTDPYNPFFISKYYDPSVWFALDKENNKQFSYIPQWNYWNGYLFLLTAREGLLIYDVRDFKNIKLYSMLLHFTKAGLEANNYIDISGYDLSFLEYKNVTMVCHGHQNQWYAYTGAVCSIFGETSPWKRQFKKAPFPLSALKTRNQLDASSNTSAMPTPTTMFTNGTREKDAVNLDAIPYRTTVGSIFSCALFMSGTVRCWGQNRADVDLLTNLDSGVLGIGKQIALKTPSIGTIEFEDPSISSRIIDLSSGNLHSCAVLYRPKAKAEINQTSIFCWGWGGLGRLGYGDEAVVGYPESPRIKGPLKFKDAAPLRVFAGQYHTCAVLKNLTSNLRVARCWGDSSVGQSGYPLKASVLDASTAPDIAIGAEPALLALGSYHTCALTTDGRVKCWGSGTSGQTGTKDDSKAEYNVRDPATLPFLSTPNNMKVIDICAGSIHTCVLMENRQVYCIGSNNRGQVGQPITASDDNFRFHSFDKPVNLNTNETVTGLTCGYLYTCVWFASGAFNCWGDNTPGVLGVATPDRLSGDPSVRSPIRIKGSTVDWISAGEGQTCAVTTTNGEGKIRCWGTSFFDEKSISYANDAADIWPIPSDRNYIQQISTYHMTCALTKERNVKCWGNGNGFQLGTTIPYDMSINDEDTQGVLQPASGAKNVVPFYIPVPAVAVVAGEWCGCALLSTGNVSCWGYNEWAVKITAQFAQHTNLSIDRVVSVVLPRGPTGGCILFENGVPFCYSNIYWRGGQDPAHIVIPPLPGRIVQMAMGEFFHCALSNTGQVACFGFNTGGQLALGNSSNDWHVYDNTDLAKIPPGQVVKIAAGKNHACALYKSGDVACWGSGVSGQTGYGTIEDMGDDEPVEGFVDIGPYPAIDLACGNTHTCVLVQAPDRNRVVCWGLNIGRQLGYPDIYGNVGDDETPASAGFVPMDDNPISISTGSLHTCVLTDVGTVKCWGSGDSGRLGYTGVQNVIDPSKVPDISITCGDGVKEYNEECDDGNFNDNDGCSKCCKIEDEWTCRAQTGTFTLCAHCGDFVVSLDETCDDGNALDGDGCNSTCGTEVGWDCTEVRGTLCEPIHGDGLIVGPEKCDLGNLTGIAFGCSNASTILPGFYCKTEPPFASTCWSVCGDGKKSTQESCDDGNMDNGDGCSSSCSIESGWTCYTSCDSELNCRSVCSSNSDNSSKVGLIVGLCVGLSLLVILLLLLLFFCMSRKRQILIKESDLTLIRKIGEGDFGEVYEAKWKSTTVAVKQRKIDGISEEEIRMFSKEARVMQALPPHPNLVQFLGLCSTSDKLTIVCEFVEKGSVKRFLQEDCGKNTVTKRNQLELCLGICAGMDHLHSNGITHRDLACRNVLVEVKRSGNGFSLVPKISDFGLSVATSKQTRLPVRWTAPEVLKNPRSRNKEADVWSFGVTMYEVFTRCSELPYLGKKNQEVVAFVLGGGHLKEPPQVDGIIRDVMLDCFKFKPEWRPPFIVLSARFEDIIKDMTNPTMTSNDTFSTIDTVETTSLQMFSDEDENDYMSMAKSEYSSSNLTSSNVKKGNTYEVVKSTDYESLAK